MPRVYPELNLHIRSPLSRLLDPFSPTLDQIHRETYNNNNKERMNRVRKRDRESSPDLPRRSTRYSKTSPNTSSTTQPPKKPEMRLPTSPIHRKVEIKSGEEAWERDFKKLKSQWKRGEIEGYGGLMATITSETSIRVGAEGRF